MISNARECKGDNDLVISNGRGMVLRLAMKGDNDLVISN